MDPSIDSLSAHNGGYFTRSEAVNVGWVDRDLAAAVRQGTIRRLRHGAYSPALVYDSLDEIERHVLLARTALRSQRGPVALTGISAAAAHGLALYSQDLSTVHLVRLDQGSSRHETGINHHVVLADLSEEIEVVRGCRAVSMARAVWEVASMSSVESGVCTADSALHTNPQLPTKLHELAPCWWPDFHHLGEFDGKVKYGRLLRPGETAGDAVFREKRREDSLRSAGHGMSRWTWPDLMPAHSRAFTRRLLKELDRSRTLYSLHQTVAPAA